VSRAIPLVCSIGSSDPTGGAGIGLDIALNALLGVRSAIVVTGVTAQNSRGVSLVAPLDAKAIRAQLGSVWSEARPDAIRIGLMPGVPAIRAVRTFFKTRANALPPIILDPVLASTSGRRFAEAKDIAELTKIFKYAELVTPNADEAAVLADMPVRSVEDAADAAQRIARRAGCAVLVKGGHLGGGTCFDVLADRRGVVYIGAKRLRTTMRGTGCVLAAAIAAYRAHGLPLLDAIERARDIIAHAMRHATPLGRGRPLFNPAGSASTRRQRMSEARLLFGDKE